MKAARTVDPNDISENAVETADFSEVCVCVCTSTPVGALPGRMEGQGRRLVRPTQVLLWTMPKAELLWGVQPRQGLQQPLFKGVQDPVGGEVRS